MAHKFWFIKYLIVASIPFVVLLATRKRKLFKKKPHFLYFLMAFPTFLVGGLFYLYA